MKPPSRLGIFKGQHSDPQLILCAVRWYWRSSLPFREAAARLRAPGLPVDHTTLWRWVRRYGPELQEPRRPLTPLQPSWRVEETAVRVKGRWYFLDHALDASGDTLDVVLSGMHDAAPGTPATAAGCARAYVQAPAEPVVVA